MPTSAAAGSRDLEAGAYCYQRHQRENNRLCRIVERYYPEFTASLAEQGAILPLYVQREFEDYLNPNGTYLSRYGLLLEEMSAAGKPPSSLHGRIHGVFRKK